MAALNVAGVAALLKEKQEVVTALFDYKDALCSRIMKGAAEKVSNRAMRIPLIAGPGGQTGALNLDGGSYMVGTGRLYKEAQVTTIGIQHVRGITKKAVFSSDTDDKSKLRILADETANCITELKDNLDSYLQGGEDGILAYIGGVGATPILDVNHASNPFGAYLLREGGVYDLYTAAGALCINGPYYITQDGGIDYDGELVTFTAAPTGIDVGGKIYVRGGKDAWFRGLAYHVNDSQSGNWQTLARTLPYVRANKVAGGTALLDRDKIRLALNKVVIRRGEKAAKKLEPYMGPAQKHAYEQIMDSLSQVFMKPQGGEMVDVMYSDIAISGKKPILNAHADPTKVQFLDFSQFKRAEMHPIKFIEIEDSTIWTLRDTTTGAPTTNLGFGMEAQFQVYCLDPTVNVYIDALTVPTGYVG